jgi:hypothetical protein
MVMNVTQIACHDGLETNKGATFFMTYDALLEGWMKRLGSVV